MTRFRRRRWGFATGLAMAAALVAPAGASALDVSIRQVQVEARFLVLEDNDGVRDFLAVTAVTPSGGSPDLVIGDTTAGIQDPIPGICARVDPEIIRCPAGEFGVNLGVMPVLAGGDDELTITLDVVPVVSGKTRVAAKLGRGADRARDFSGWRDFWAGGPGPDDLFLGPGRDRANGGSGNDRVRGGAQNDIINCGPGPFDIGIGGPGRDLGKNCEQVGH